MCDQALRRLGLAAIAWCMLVGVSLGDSIEVPPGDELRFDSEAGRRARVSYVSDASSDRIYLLNGNDQPLFAIEDDVNENVLVNLFNWEHKGDSIYRWFRIVDGGSLPYPWIFGEDRTDHGFDRDLFIGRDQMWANFRCKLDGTMWLGRELAGPPDRVHPLVLEAEGNVRVQNSAEEPAFYVNGAARNVGIGTDDASNILTVRQDSPTDPIADAWTVYSSRRWKENIQPVENALDKVRAMRAVRFDWKGRDRADIGLIAEEVAEVVPEAVGYEQDGKTPQSLDYARIVPVLIEAIKDQQRQIEALQSALEVGRD